MIEPVSPPSGFQGITLAPNPNELVYNMLGWRGITVGTNPAEFIQRTTGFKGISVEFDPPQASGTSHNKRSFQ